MTLSRAGVSTSIGVKGARLTTGPRGTYVTLGSKGITYKQRVVDSNQTNNENHENKFFQLNHYNYNPTDVSLIKTASIDEFDNSSFNELITSINDRISQPRYAPVVICVFILLFFLTGGFSSIVSWLLIIIGMLITTYFSMGDRENKTTPVFYDLSTDLGKRFQSLSYSIDTVSQSQKIWRVDTRQVNYDWKRNAGATSLLNRSIANIHISNPPFISSNIKIPGLVCNRISLWFMPDFLLLHQDGRYAAVRYNDLNIEFYPTRFIENENVPSDAEIVGSTWQYVNKRGGPDKRFNNNRQIPIVEYGEIKISSSSGLNIIIHISNLARSKNLSQVFEGFKSNIVSLK